MSLYLHIEPGPVAKRLGRRTFWLGLALLAVGTLGIVLPELVALTVSYAIAWLLILASVLLGYLTWSMPVRDTGNWIKVGVLFILGVLLAILPQLGIATLTLLLAFYFLLDALTNALLAKQIYPFDGWGWMALNSLLTFALAVLALWGFPENTAVFMGVIIGVSLLLDGIVFTRIGWALKKHHEVSLHD